MMQTRLRAVAVVMLCAGVLAAQRSRSYVSPPGAHFEEGYAASAVQFGFADTSTESRTQQIDNTFVGYPQPIILRGIAWRRDGNKGPNSVKRTGELEVVMSHADFANPSNSFATNYKDKPVTVFTRKKVNLPDWTVQPLHKPASFDLALPFDVMFIYNRKDALLYDLQVRNLSSSLSYHMDFYRDNQLDYGFGQWPALLGTGCTTKNGEMVQACCLRAKTSLEMLFRVWGAPSSAPTLALVGGSDPNLFVPGLCATLHSDLLLILPLKAAQADGKVPPTTVLSVPWSPAYAGLVFYNQCLALDPSQTYGVALSSAQRCPAPTTNVKSSLPMHMIYSPRNASSSTGVLEKKIGCPTMFFY